MKGKRWLVLVVIAAVLVGVRLYWDTLVLYAAPQAALCRAAQNYAGELQERLSDNPLTPVLDAMDTHGDQTYLLTLTKRDPVLGEMMYDMAVTTDASPGRMQAEGTIATNSRVLDLQCYMDQNFAAVCSQGLLDGGYYGITFATFGQALREQGMLTFLLGDETLDQLESELKELQTRMAELPDPVPQMRWEDIQSGIRGLMALKLRVYRDSIYVNGRVRNVHRMESKYTGLELVKASEMYRSQFPREIQEILTRMQQDPESYVQASCYLWEDRLISVSARLVVGQEAYLLDAQLGTAAGEDQCVSLRWFDETGEEGMDILLHREGGSECITAASKNTPYESGQVWFCAWTPGSDHINLRMTEDEETIAVSATIQKTEEGVQISTQEAGNFLCLLSLADEADYGQGSFTICPAREIETPEYRDFSQWSVEDLLILLSNLGGFLGLPTG